MNNEALEVKNEVEVLDRTSVVDVDFVDGILTQSRSYCSFKAVTRDEQVIYANAMNNPTHRISDKINEVIMMKDVYLETLKMKKEDTGELVDVPRIIIFDDKGQSYQAVSVGLYSALSKIMSAFGQPTWHDPIPVKIKQISRKDRKMLTLEVVSVKK